MILFFLQTYFPDIDNMVKPVNPVSLVTDNEYLKSLISGNDYDEDYKNLIKNVRQLNENIPPLVNAYMNLSSTMRVFGTALNDHFGRVEETGILITIDDIYDIKKDRHVLSYNKK